MNRTTATVLASLITLTGCSTSSSDNRPPIGMQESAEACVEFQRVMTGTVDGTIAPDEGVDRMMNASVTAAGAAYDNPEWTPLSDALLELAIGMTTRDPAALRSALPAARTQCDNLMTRIENATS